MLTLKQLKHALAVEKTLHFKKAAEACNVSQSALSTSLNELEKQLGFQIFERDNKKVLITPIGRRVLEKARDINVILDDLKQLTDSQKAPLNFPMTIGIIPTIAPYLLPLVLPEITKNHPNFQLTVVEGYSNTLEEKLKTGEIDAAILALPYPTQGLLSFDFWQENFVWVTHVDDPLSDQPTVKSDAINPDELMLLKDGHCLKDQALSVCHFSSSASSITMEATSLFTLMPMVAAKMGTTIIPEMAVQQLVEPFPSLRAIPLDEPGPHRTIAFLVRPNYTSVHSIQLMSIIAKKTLSGALDDD